MSDTDFNVIIGIALFFGALVWIFNTRYTARTPEPEPQLTRFVPKFKQVVKSANVEKAIFRITFEDGETLQVERTGRAMDSNYYWGYRESGYYPEVIYLASREISAYLHEFKTARSFQITEHKFKVAQNFTVELIRIEDHVVNYNGVENDGLREVDSYTGQEIIR